jgi:hypothetical protein
MAIFYIGRLLLNLSEVVFSFVAASYDFVDKFEELLVFDFSVEEVEMMLVLDVREHIGSGDVGLAHDRVQSHFMVVQLACVDH